MTLIAFYYYIFHCSYSTQLFHKVQEVNFYHETSDKKNVDFLDANQVWIPKQYS